MNPLPEVLTAHSLRWPEFYVRLSNTLTILAPRCGGDHRYAKEVMAEMGGIDIDATLAFFKQHGGHCDCEILMNVDDRDYWRNQGGQPS
jgi:Protein of unknown function (DUF2695)